MRRIKTITFKNAESFLKRLNLHDPLWRGQENNRWAFRGQPDDTYELVPKSLRPNTKLSLNDPEIIGPRKTLKEQQNYEYQLILNFASLADEIGLPVPGFINEMRNPYSSESYRTRIFLEWPDFRILELFALAQHHGVPTRLLDFTYDPLVAAYFAASQAINDDNGKGRNLAIWAIDLKYILTVWDPMWWTNDRSIGQIRIVNAPKADNRFLHQQKALFLYDQLASEYFRKHEKYQSINEVITYSDKWAESNIADADVYPPIIKITIPKEKAELILENLRRLKYNKAHLMPTYDNVWNTLVNDGYVSY